MRKVSIPHESNDKTVIQKSSIILPRYVAREQYNQSENPWVNLGGKKNVNVLR